MSDMKPKTVTDGEAICRRCVTHKFIGTMDHRGTRLNDTTIGGRFHLSSSAFLTEIQSLVFKLQLL